MIQIMLLNIFLLEGLHVIERMFLENGITLATWALVIVTALLVIVTFLLVVDSFRKSREQRIRWTREDEERDKDKTEERERWKREDQFHRLQSLDLRFNSPGMIAARKRMANELREMKLSQILGKPTPEIWPVIAILNEVAQLCKEGLVDFAEADFAYREHVMIIWLKYGSFLSEQLRIGQFGTLGWLKDEMSRTTSAAAIDSELTAAVPFVQDDFLEREANL
ncbi:MAG: hypothetical protein ABSA48_15245 [Terracidiphilus sp.]|jgi:hypothetical protein